MESSSLPILFTQDMSYPLDIRSLANSILLREMYDQLKALECHNKDIGRLIHITSRFINDTEQVIKTHESICHNQRSE